MRARGIADLYVVAGLVVLGLAAVWVIHGWYAGAIESAKEEGRNEVRNGVLADRNKQLVAVQQRVSQLEAQVREAEDRAQAAIAAAEEKGLKGVADAQVAKDQFVSDVVAGRVRLFDPGRNSGASCPGGSGRSEAVARGPGVGDGAGGGQLSDEAAVFLFSEATRADKVVAKLTACQGVVIACQKLNAP